MLMSKLSRGALSLLSTGELCAVASTAASGRRQFSASEIGKRHPKPFDYKRKQYGSLWHLITDSSVERLGENSLIITVEGNFGAGKSEFAQKLAKRIDFVHAREPDLITHAYTRGDGLNMRDAINKFVGPNNARYHMDSLDEWHLNPTFKSTIQVQFHYYMIRWMQLRTALIHLFSTGQGVVLERSVFSDSLIAQALYENDFLSDSAWRYYIRSLLPLSLSELWRPHVSIYMDKPAESCLKTIAEKGQPFEKDSKVYSLKFLKSIEKNYKEQFLPEQKKHLHVLNYDMKELDVETVVEDLELLDFEDVTKFGDWRHRRETNIDTFRKIISDYDYCMGILKLPEGYVDVPENLWWGVEYQSLKEKLPNVFNEEANAPVFVNPFAKAKEPNYL